MKAREIVQAYIEYYGIDNYVDFTIYEKDLKVATTRKGRTEYRRLDNKSELIKLKAILVLMEIDFGLID